MSFKAKLLNILALICALLSAQVSAHVHLSKTFPVAESESVTPPEKLKLGFSAEVKVIKLKLTESSGNTVDFGFKPALQSAKSMEWSLPMLSSGNYQVDWTVLGNDGHKMSGNYAFVVKHGHEHHASH
ncbi:MAG: copper resistance CopC family protein [Paraglaciecola sp.]